MTYSRSIPKPAEAGDCAGVRGRLLIYAPVPVFRRDGRFWVEAQACNGLRLWAENFPHVTAMMPLEEGPPPAGWLPVNEIGPALERIAIEALPIAYRPDRFLRSLRPTRKRIGGLIDAADYLSFAIGGLFGDWGSVASLEAHRRGRPFAVWTDRVESEVMRRHSGSETLKSRLKSRLFHRPMAALERHVIRRAEIGLFHGRDTFDFYRPFCRNPILVHDIHIARQDHIPQPVLAEKIAAAGNGPLRIVYAGRADAMKGPLQWLDVLERLEAMGVEFQATWLGGGDEIDRMRQRVREAGLEAQVALPGFTDDRKAVLETLREAHVFLFCHLTPESPRCLIEALVSGCPIVGYTSAFAADLVEANQGGRLVPVGEVDALADCVAELARDRRALGALIGAAARDGRPFDDVSVFRHRSDVIKANL